MKLESSSTDERGYVAEQLGIIAGRPVKVPLELANEVWAALSRSEELGVERDRHGNFPASASRLYRSGDLERPPLLDAVAKAGFDDDGRWPNGHRFAAVLTHDVDRIVSLPARARWRQAAGRQSSASLSWRLRWAAAAGIFGVRSLVGHNDRDPFGWYIEEEARFGFHSTFFVLSDRLEAPTRDDHWYRLDDTVEYTGTRMTLSEAARRANATGWEIGLHGSYSSFDNADILRRERKRLEDAFGLDVTSTRQHFLRFDAERTPVAHADAGFKADSTLGFGSTFGCRVGLALPYFWPSQPDLLELPITIQDVGLLRHNASTTLDVEEATERAVKVIEYVADRGGAITLAWHTHPEPGSLPVYRTLLETVARRGGWGCSVDEMDSWWRRRRDQLRDAVQSAAVHSQMFAAASGGALASALLTAT